MMNVQENFAAECTPAPPPEPEPPAPPAGTTCVSGLHGPVCTKGAAGDDLCKDYSGCLRCASSGFCTDVPK